MSDISKIRVGNSEYNIKDSTARNALSDTETLIFELEDGTTQTLTVYGSFTS